MRDTTKRQIKNGLRWGGGLAVFLLAMLPLADGLRRTIWAGYAHQPMELLGWLELGVAAVLFVSTANVWVYYILGCMVFGAIKGIGFMVVGGAGTLLQMTELLIFIFGAILLLVGIIPHPPTLVDRIALTLFIFSIAWHADRGLFLPSPSLLVGLMFLFLSWCFHYWRRRHAGTSRDSLLQD